MAKYNRYYREQKYYLGQPVDPPVYRQGGLYEQNVEYETQEECEIGTIIPLPPLTTPVLPTVNITYNIPDETETIEVDLGHQFKLDSVNYIMTDDGMKLLVYGNPKYENEFVGVIIQPDGQQIIDVDVTNDIFGYEGYSLNPLCCQTFYYSNNVMKMILHKEVNNAHEYIIVNINMTNSNIETQVLDNFIFDNAWGDIYAIDNEYIYTKRYVYNYTKDEIIYNNLARDNGYFYFNSSNELIYYWYKSYSVPSDITRATEIEIFNMKQNKRYLYTPQLFNMEYFGEYRAIFPFICDIYYWNYPDNIVHIYNGTTLYNSSKQFTDRFIQYGDACYYEPLVSSSVCTIYKSTLEQVS